MPADRTPRVAAISTSGQKGTPKTNVAEAVLIADWGIEGDAHGGSAQRQVSLLALESIESMNLPDLQVGPGSFAENITTAGLKVSQLPIGTRLTIGGCELEITQIGKECHERCNIFEIAGDCVMPREGVFARVLRGGLIRRGDRISVREATPPANTGPERTG